MVKLNDLTIPYIKRLAKEAQIDLHQGRKADLINQIKSSGISELQLNSLIKKYLKEKNKTKIKKKRSLLNIPELEKRVKKLESQIEYLISIINKEKNLNLSKSEVQGTHEIPEKKRTIPKIEIETLSDLQDFIKLLLEPGEAITIDELIKVEELQNISFNLLKQAINKLIASGALEASEGKSIQKIQGNIGELIRKR